MTINEITTIQSDRTVEDADWREGAEFTVYDKFV